MLELVLSLMWLRARHSTVMLAASVLSIALIAAALLPVAHRTRQPSPGSCDLPRWPDLYTALDPDTLTSVCGADLSPIHLDKTHGLQCPFEVSSVETWNIRAVQQRVGVRADLHLIADDGGLVARLIGTWTMLVNIVHRSSKVGLPFVRYSRLLCFLVDCESKSR